MCCVIVWCKAVRPTRCEGRALFTLMGLRARHRLNLKALDISQDNMSHFPCEQHSHPQTERFPARSLLVDMLSKQAGTECLQVLTWQIERPFSHPQMMKTTDSHRSFLTHIPLVTAHRQLQHARLRAIRLSLSCTQPLIQSSSTLKAFTWTARSKLDRGDGREQAAAAQAEAVHCEDLHPDTHPPPAGNGGRLGTCHDDDALLLPDVHR